MTQQAAFVAGRPAGRSRAGVLNTLAFLAFAIVAFGALLSRPAWKQLGPRVRELG